MSWNNFFKFIQLISMFNFIHIDNYSYTNLISCSLIGSLINTRSVFCVDCAQCFCCRIAHVIVTSTDTFFQWVKLLIFFIFTGIYKTFYLQFFQKHEQMILFFCSVWIWSIGLVAREMIQIHCTCADVDVHPMHSPSVRPLDEHQNQRACTGFEWFLS